MKKKDAKKAVNLNRKVTQDPLGPDVWGVNVRLNSMTKVTERITPP